MPNQYTKFKAALENGQPYEFRFKTCPGQKPRKQKNVKAKISPSQRTVTPDSVLIYTPSNGLRIDPFKSYPVRPNQAELSVLDHCMWVERRTIGVTDKSSFVLSYTFGQPECSSFWKAEVT